MPFAHHDHRLDREGEPGLQGEAATATPEVRNVRLLMHRRPDAVPAVLLDDAVAALGPHVRLDGVPDVSEVAAGDAGRDPPPHRLFTDVEHGLDRRIDGANASGERGVAVPAVDDRAAIDRDDVAVAQHMATIRDAVDNLVVDRRANRSGIRDLAAGATAIALEVR